jgi:hypothetical protein
MHRMDSNPGSIVGGWWLLPRVLVGLLIVTTALAERGQTIARASGPLPEWSTELGHVERALAAGQIAPALRAWERARGAAHASHQWQGPLEVGDAYLRIGDAVELRRAFVATARGLYLEALERARATASLDGVLRIAAVLGALDDDPDVRQVIGAACRAVTGRACEGQTRIAPGGDAS